MAVVNENLAKWQPLSAATAHLAGLLGGKFSFGAGLLEGVDDIVEGR